MNLGVGHFLYILLPQLYSISKAYSRLLGTRDCDVLPCYYFLDLLLKKCHYILFENQTLIY